MLVVGLTGGIGSGKSSVANLFAKLGVPIIDADVIAKELTLQNKLAFRPIIEHFGQTILQENGDLNRKKLREIIFKDSGEKIWLEKLLHPLIEEEIQNQLALIKAPYCVLVIPLLLEVSPYHFIDRILVIDTLPENQIERVMSRDQLQKEEVLAIMQTQLNRIKRLSQAHDVIINNGDLKDLEEKVELLHQFYSTFK